MQSADTTDSTTADATAKINASTAVSLTSDIDIDSDATTSEYVPVTEARYDVSRLLDVKTPHDELITKTIDLKNPQNIHNVLRSFTEPGFYYTSMGELEEQLGIECLRQADTTPKGAVSPYYAVYKPKQGGLVYAFFGGNKDFDRPIAWYHCVKRFSSADLKDIKGKTMQDVAKIDPGMQSWITIYNADKEFWDAEGVFVSEHYLTDGLMKIYYKGENGNLLVEEVIFYDDYINTVKIDYGRARAQYCKVLEMDEIK